MGYGKEKKEMKYKKIISCLLPLIGAVAFPLIGNAGDWDTVGYGLYGEVDLEYTNRSFSGVYTNTKKPNNEPFNPLGVSQLLTFLPNPKDYKEYVDISLDGGLTYTSIGEPDESNSSKGEYKYFRITKGTVFRVRNMAFSGGYSLDAKITVHRNGYLTIKTGPEENLFNYDVNLYDYPEPDTPSEGVTLEVIDSRNGKEIPPQLGRYFLLSSKEVYWRGYDSRYTPLGLNSNHLKYYQNSSDPESKWDKSIFYSNGNYMNANYLSHYGGNIPYLKNTIITRHIYFQIGEKVEFLSAYASGMTMRTTSLFYNSKMGDLPESYENTTLSYTSTSDGKYNAEFIVKQSFPSQSNANYYPEGGIEMIPDLSNNQTKRISLDSITTEDGQVLDSSNYTINEETKSIIFSREAVKKLRNQTILIKYKTDLDYATDKNVISEFYNRENHTFDIPFGVNVKVKFSNVFDNRLDEIAKIKYPLDITAKSKKLEVKAGETSGDYSIEDYLDMSTLALSYPNQTIKLKTDFDHNIKFDKIGSTTVPVTISCDELNLSQIVNVDVTVKSEPASYSDKVTLTHEVVDNQVQYSIVQELPKQYDTTFLPTSLDYEVEIPNSEYLSFMNFTQPSLTIDGQVVPETLYTYNKDTYKLSLGKELLTTYEDKALNIIFKSQIDKENKKILDFVKETSSADSLDLNTSIAFKITSIESPIEKGDTEKYKKDTILSIPLNFSITSNNLAVLVGQKVGDYLLKDYVDETTATTGVNILDELLSNTLLTPDDMVITQDLNQLKVLMSVNLGSKLILKKEIAISIQPILKQPYIVSMGEQFNKADTSNAHFYSYLEIPSQANDIALPEQVIIKLDVTKEQASIIKPRIQKVDGIPVGNYTISDDRTQLVINKTNLKKHSGKTVKIYWKTNMNYRVPQTIEYFYDKINHTFNLSDVNTVATVSYLMSGDELSKSDVSKSYAIAYDFKFKAEALSPSYPSGTSTADDLDIKMFVRNINVDYYETGFKRDFIASFPKEPILFEKVGSTVMVPITITSETLGLTKVIKVPVLVTEELKLGFESVPEILNIVSLTTENGENESNKSLYHLNSKEELIVKDTRKTKFWRLSMIPSELKGVSTDSKTKGKTLAGEFVERKNNKTISLIPLEEYLLKKSDKETETISELWNKATKENGMFYENNTSSNYAGQYNGTITWQLSDVPE